MKEKKNKRVQANVDLNLANEAETIMNEVGLNPTVVINALYKKIVATGGIPFNFQLTPDQMADIRLQKALEKVPVHDVKTEKDLEEFFDED